MDKSASALLTRANLFSIYLWRVEEEEGKEKNVSCFSDGEETLLLKMNLKIKNTFSFKASEELGRQAGRASASSALSPLSSPPPPLLLPPLAAAVW